MSRCFPYPPPGFEKKARGDHSDLLAKVYNALLDSLAQAEVEHQDLPDVSDMYLVDLPAQMQEKQKEGEHKKEKRDKEKKDKDNSRNKHKEKKERKERHKDKKRDKDKNRIPDDKRIEGQTGGRNEQKVGSTFSEEFGRRNKDEKGTANSMLEFAGSISKAEEVDDSRFAEELGRRMEVEKKVAASRMHENITGSIPERVKSLGTSTAVEKERSNGKPMVANFVSNGKRKADEVSRPPPEKTNHHHQALHNHQGLPNGKPTVANFSKEQRGADRVGHTVEKDNQKHQVLSHRTPMVSNCISTEQRRVDESTRAVEKGSLNHQPLLQTPKGSHSHQPLLQTPTETDEVKKEKGKDRKVDNGHGDRRKDREREEKKSKRKEKNRDKGKEKEEEQKQKKRVNGENSHDTPKDSGSDQVDNLKFKPLAPRNNNGNFAGNHGNSKKRKEIEMNGFSHVAEGEVPPNKLPRPASSSHVPNGKTLGFDHIHTTCPSSTRHGSQNNIKAERLLKHKEHTMNGTVVTQASPADLKPLLAAVTQPAPTDLKPLLAAVAQPAPADLKPSAAAVTQPSPVESKLSLSAVAQPSPAALKPSFSAVAQPSPADLKPPLAVVAQPYAAALKPSFAADASGKSKVSKPPHPDTKFLSQIYSLQKTEAWPEYDDQEWLFSSSDHQPKPKVETEAEEEVQVWAGGLKIESADVFALPYVIPY